MTGGRKAPGQGCYRESCRTFESRYPCVTLTRTCPANIHHLSIFPPLRLQARPDLARPDQTVLNLKSRLALTHISVCLRSLLGKYSIQIMPRTCMWIHLCQHPTVSMKTIPTSAHLVCLQRGFESSCNIPREADQNYKPRLVWKVPNSRFVLLRRRVRSIKAIKARDIDLPNRQLYSHS
jgi:hypothetical protein